MRSTRNYQYSKREKSPLEIMFLIDTSLSMKDQKINSVNYFMKDIIGQLARKAKDETKIQINITVITFSNNEAQYYDNLVRMDAEKAVYHDIKNDQLGGLTSTAKALHIVNEMLDINNFPQTKYGPVCILISDGWDTDVVNTHDGGEGKRQLREELEVLKNSFWGKHTRRLAIQIGKEGTFDREFLNGFTRNDANVFKAKDQDAVINAIKWASTIVDNRTKANTEEEGADLREAPSELAFGDFDIRFDK